MHVCSEQNEELVHFSVSQNNARAGRIIQGGMIIMLFYYQGFIYDFRQGGPSATIAKLRGRGLQLYFEYFFISKE